MTFSQDEDGNFNLSPYDVFLAMNDLPQQPDPKESDLDYSRRLLEKISSLKERSSLKFVSHRFLKHFKKRHFKRHHFKRPHRNNNLEFVSQNPNTDDGNFQFHDQPFRFGEQELEGLKIFFQESAHDRSRHSHGHKGGIGNCIACHAAPKFTDFALHNNGTTQAEYDRIHGQGTFAQLSIPGLKKRNRSPNEFLSATEQHPDAKEPFRSVPTPDNPQLVDLGIWNIFGNPDFPNSQESIQDIVCHLYYGDQRDQTRKKHHRHFRHPCSTKHLLPKTIAIFKTPGLQDLELSAPYSHTGQAETLDDVIHGYISNANLARLRISGMERLNSRRSS